MKKLLCFILIVSMMTIAVSSCAPTKRDAEKIVPGMTYEEVCDIMGSEGVEVGFGMIIYVWKLANGKEFSVCFTRNYPDNELIVQTTVME